MIAGSDTGLYRSTESEILQRLKKSL